MFWGWYKTQILLIFGFGLLAGTVCSGFDVIVFVAFVIGYLVFVVFGFVWVCVLGCFGYLCCFIVFVLRLW